MLRATNRGEEATWTCTVLYSKYDAQRLAAVVGVERAAQMLQSKKNVHLFITGEKWNFVGQEVVFGMIHNVWFYATWTQFWLLTEEGLIQRKCMSQCQYYLTFLSFQVMCPWKVKCKPDFGKSHFSEVKRGLEGLWEVGRRKLPLVNIFMRHKFFYYNLPLIYYT